MSKGRCVVCGEEIPAAVYIKKDVHHCMVIDSLEWHPSLGFRKTTYTNLFVCHKCANQIVNNIAYNDANWGIE